MKMLKNLKTRTRNERNVQNAKIKIDIDFVFRDELLYHQNEDERNKFCVFENCEKEIFQITHDQIEHMRH